MVDTGTPGETSVPAGIIEALAPAENSFMTGVRVVFSSLGRVGNIATVTCYYDLPIVDE